MLDQSAAFHIELDLKGENSKQAEVDKVLAMKVIAPKQMQSIPRIIWEEKQDRAIRCCVDYWKRSAVTIFHTYRISGVDKIVDFVRPNDTLNVPLQQQLLERCNSEERKH